MDKRIDLLNSNLDRSGATPANARPHFLTSKKFKISTVILLMFLLIYSSYGIITGHEESTSWFYNLPGISQIRHLVKSADIKLKGEERSRVNILLLGIGGKNHMGGALTDTIILASIEPKEKKVALISIPRDLAVPIENMGFRKINNVNALAESQAPGSGGLAVSQTVSDLFKIPIDYYLTVDFAGFVKIVDDLGGIKVNVDNAFDDYKYPILGNEEAPYDQRYEHLRVEKGEQTMNGSLALKYVRSRHAFGVEGSDFARARRQQKVLEALKEKVMSPQFLLRPNLISQVIGDIRENYSTNLKTWEMLKLWSIAKETKNENIHNQVLDNGPGGLLVDYTGEDGAYLLTPRSGDFSEIQYLVQNIFAEAPTKDKEKVTRQPATLEIRNGTWINGLANSLALDLEKYGFRVARVGNSSQKNFEKSVIYDLTYGEKIQALTVLKDKINANVALGMPEWLKDDLAKELSKGENPVQPDFIIILGRSADSTGSGTENTEE